MSEELLKKAIKNNEIGSLYLFYGQEEYLKRNYTDYIEKKLLKEDLKLLNKVVLEGKVTPASIIDNCETLPVFSDRKVIVVKNSGIFKGRKKDDESGKKSKSDDALAAFLQNVPEYTCLIFIEAEIDKRIPIIIIMQKETTGLLNISSIFLSFLYYYTTQEMYCKYFTYTALSYQTYETYAAITCALANLLIQ